MTTMVIIYILTSIIICCLVGFAIDNTLDIELDITRYLQLRGITENGLDFVFWLLLQWVFFPVYLVYWIIVQSIYNHIR